MIFSNVTLANASIANGALFVLLAVTNSGLLTASVTASQRSSSATTGVDVLIVVHAFTAKTVVVVVVPTAALDSPSRGAKNSSVASRVKYFPLHFSA